MLVIDKDAAAIIAADIRQLLAIDPSNFVGLTREETQVVVSMRRRRILASLQERGIFISGYEDCT